MLGLKRLSYSFAHHLHVYNKLLHQVHSKVGVIYLNSQEDNNALSQDLKDQMVHCLEEYEKNRDVRAIVILSKLKDVFCAGDNLKFFEGKTKADFAANDIYQPLNNAFGRTTKPIISGVNGTALGSGCEMALLGDIIVCSDDAVFGLPEITIGLIPGIGGTQRFNRIFGKINSMRYILTGDFIPAEKAQELGLVSDIYPSEQLHTKTLDLARLISQKPIRALKAAKKAIKESQQLPLQKGISFERRLFYPLFNSKGARQGIKAFVQKRSPNIDIEESTTQQ